MNILLFVYGTLKMGFSRNYALNGQIYLGTAKTKPEYSMYALNGYPALVDQRMAEKNKLQVSTSVFGEIWEVDEETITKIDKIEGTDIDLFERKAINIDEFTLSRLPLDKSVWRSIEDKIALSYIYKQNIYGAAICGSFWHKR
jgi:gamma-glutamylcyclotransferase (GGCT)/AIG2-like uncharacterized protein YtfP